MANEGIKPIPTISGAQAHAEGEMDALLLGRTRVSWLDIDVFISSMGYP